MAQLQPGYSGTPVIVIDGTDVTGSIGDGLVFGQDTAGSSQPSVVEGLSLVNWKFSSQFGGGTAIDIGPLANNPLTIQGNYIGVEPDGTTVAGNDVSGITVQSPQNIIGGTTAADRNIIGGNGNNAPSIETGAGIIVETGTENVIQGNYIGVSADGQTAVPNDIGVLMTVDTNSSDLGNKLGGTLSGDGNVISGNTGVGVDLDADEFDLVQGNIIGMNAADTVAVPNGGGGILAHDEALSDTIGGVGTGAGNVIAGNTGNGVSVGTNTSPPNSAGIDIQDNSITANTGLGIALGRLHARRSINDSEGHVGPNALQNYPDITSANGFERYPSRSTRHSARPTSRTRPWTSTSTPIRGLVGLWPGRGSHRVGAAPRPTALAWEPQSVSPRSTMSRRATSSPRRRPSPTRSPTASPSATHRNSPRTSRSRRRPHPRPLSWSSRCPPRPTRPTPAKIFGLTVSAENGSGTLDMTYDQEVMVRS